MSAESVATVPGLPGLLDIRILTESADRAEAVRTIGPRRLAATCYLHAGCVLALGDTACGYGCLAALPGGKTGFTTVQAPENHLATAAVGQQLRAVATRVHHGRTIRVSDARHDDSGDTGRTISVFRCTQLLLDGRR